MKDVYKRQDWECVKDVSAKFDGLFCVWKIYNGIVMVDSREMCIRDSHSCVP